MKTEELLEQIGIVTRETFIQLIANNSKKADIDIEFVREDNTTLKLNIQLKIDEEERRLH